MPRKTTQRKPRRAKIETIRHEFDDRGFVELRVSVDFLSLGGRTLSELLALVEDFRSWSANAESNAPAPDFGPSADAPSAAESQ